MSMKVYDKRNEQELEVMEYKYPANKEFRDFIGVKSYSENFTSKTIGDETEEEKTISFTFDGSDKIVTMAEGYYFAKNENGWLILTPEGFDQMINYKKDQEKDEDTNESYNLTDEDIEYITSKNVVAKFDFLKIAKDNLIGLIHSIGSYADAEIFIDDKFKEDIKSVFDYCDKIEDFINDKISLCNEDDEFEEDDEDMPNAELYSDVPFKDPIVRVDATTGELKEYKSAREIAEDGFWPECVISEVNARKKEIDASEYGDE